MGDGMNGIVSLTAADTFRRLLLATCMAALCVGFASAQAPTGPQSGGQPQPTPPPAQTPPAQKPQEGGLSIAVEVPVVSLDVVATTNHGDILTGLKRENFRLFEDGVPQTVTNFGPTDAPITMVVLMEFSARYGGACSHLREIVAHGSFPCPYKPGFTTPAFFQRYVTTIHHFFPQTA